ncbi:hypothetical protein ACQWTT_001158 [Acinetobacter baumannii]
MPLRSVLTVISSKPTNDLDFGTVFHDCLNAFQSAGAYSDLSHNKEKFLSPNIAIEFCRTVKGTFYGYYPLFVPTYVRDSDYIHRSPFFHFSTLAKENIKKANTALSIMLDKDEHAQTFFITLAICLIQKGYRVFLTPDNTKNNEYTEITKKSVDMHLNPTGLKQ